MQRGSWADSIARGSWRRSHCSFDTEASMSVWRPLPCKRCLRGLHHDERLRILGRRSKEGYASPPRSGSLRIRHQSRHFKERVTMAEITKTFRAYEDWRSDPSDHD